MATDLGKSVTIERKGEKKRPGASAHIRPARTKPSADFSIASYRSEFAANGPLMNIILEYLINRDAAFPYALRFPDVKILSRLGMGASPFCAMVEAVVSRNLENATIIRESCSTGSIYWNSVLQCAIEMGSVHIAKQIEPLCAGGAVNICMLQTEIYKAAGRGDLRMMAQLWEWGKKYGDAEHVRLLVGYALDGAARAGNMKGFQAAVDLGAEGFVSALHEAALGGKIAMMRHLLERKFKTVKYRPQDLLAHTGEALLHTASGGHIRATQYLFPLVPWGLTLEDLGAMLQRAAASGHVPMSRFLLNYPIKGHTLVEDIPCQRNAMPAAARYGRLAVMRLLHKAGDKAPPAFLQNWALLALKTERLSPVKLIASWGPLDPEWLLQNAALAAVPRVVIFAKGLGAKDFGAATEMVGKTVEMCRDSEIAFIRKLLDKWSRE